MVFATAVVSEIVHDGENERRVLLSQLEPSWMVSYQQGKMCTW